MVACSRQKDLKKIYIYISLHNWCINQNWVFLDCKCSFSWSRFNSVLFESDIPIFMSDVLMDWELELEGASKGCQSVALKRSHCVWYSLHLARTHLFHYWTCIFPLILHLTGITFICLFWNAHLSSSTHRGRSSLKAGHWRIVNGGSRSIISRACSWCLWSIVIAHKPL